VSDTCLILRNERTMDFINNRIIILDRLDVSNSYLENLTGSY
jgi:hypothetical protein